MDLQHLARCPKVSVSYKLLQPSTLRAASLSITTQKSTQLKKIDFFPPIQFKALNLHPQIVMLFLRTDYVKRENYTARRYAEC